MTTMNDAYSLSSLRMRRVQNLHFVGIGGAGMCGIAEVLLNEGYRVTGSDLVHSSTLDRLRNLGVTITLGHRAENASDADVVITSTAISNTNPEVQYAHSNQIPVVARAEMLGELLRHRYGIAVAGTHGKTTTTSLITCIFQEAGLDPTYIIGGLLKSEGRNAKLGGSRYLIAESDESDASFLNLNPLVVVICNIDADHLGTYEHEFVRLLDTFVEFVHRLPFYGLAVVCLDDSGVQQIIDCISRPMITYGIHPEANYRAENIRYEQTQCVFDVVRPPPYLPLTVQTCLPGIENVRNVLGAVAIATDEGVSDQHIVDGLAKFQGISRRFEISELVCGTRIFTLIDDYGHHPVEIRHVIETTRLLFKTRRLFMVYQPHRYTRTRDLFHDFVAVLSCVDLLVMVETYAAGEEPINDAKTEDLVEALQQESQISVHFASSPMDAHALVLRLVHDSDVVCIQGAGNIDTISNLLKSKCT